MLFRRWQGWTGLHFFDHRSEVGGLANWVRQDLFLEQA